MAEIALAAVSAVISALDLLEAKRISSFWDYKSQIVGLKNTVTSIENSLKDAESKVLTLEAQGYTQELKDIFYEADDLLDEFVTLLETGKISYSDTILNKVSSFFSYKGLKMFKKVKKIREKLDAVVDNRKFALLHEYKPVCSKGSETDSYIPNCNDIAIIGRDKDKKAILDKLLDKKNQNTGFLTIVGVGGVGKTALAQLVYNDEKLQQEFPNSMFWVCVSDQFDVKAILCKILESIRIQEKDRDTFVPKTREAAQNLFRQKIQGKKYFIVLDDVWNENRLKWLDLQRTLLVGQGGSRILVTTRSEITANIIDDGQIYKLQGLSSEDSWQLFEMAAFKKDNQRLINHGEMVEIGEEIVEKCSNIPLAIKVVGSNLHGCDISAWRSFKDRGLADIDKGQNQIMTVLKLSYHHLQLSLRRCFTYCAVFPKDFEINKELLINQWMAQGYIKTSDKGESVENVAEKHFKILLQRCFFQDVKKDKCDEIKSVKIHDLMHDVALEVGDMEFQVLTSGHNSFGDKTRHVTINDEKCLVESSSNLSNLRTLLITDICTQEDEGHYNEIFKSKVGKWKSLRVLELRYLDRGSSLNSVGKLLHLRYLDLSHGEFEELPNSITKLHNLLTLILKKCRELRELPHDFSKLVKLTHLNLGDCGKLKQLPHDFCKLVKLLTHLNLEGCKELTGMPLGLDRLNKLGALTNLVGRIDIEIDQDYKNVEVMKDMSREYLSKITGLKKVVISMKCEDGAEVDEAAETVLKMLEPHRNVKKLKLYYYGGRTIPWWRRAGHNSATIQFSNLVNIKIWGCYNLVNLPSFSKLLNLKSLQVSFVRNLEYMETRSSLPETTDTRFFPSLETIKIDCCKKWKGGWFREEVLGDADYGRKEILTFPCLSKVSINGCSELMSFPSCPSVKSIDLICLNKSWQLIKKMMGKKEELGDAKVGNHKSLPSQPSPLPSCLATLVICEDHELKSLTEFEEVFEMCAPSLRSLTITKCMNLSRFSRALKHLTALEDLTVCFNSRLEFSEDDYEETMAWESLHKSLHSLTFNLLNITSLPKGVQYLTSLKKLKLKECKKLEGLPEWISSLSSLQSLTIDDCGAIKSLPQDIQTLTNLQKLKIKKCHSLADRCKARGGEDWPKIKHIPNRCIR